MRSLVGREVSGMPTTSIATSTTKPICIARSSMLSGIRCRLDWSRRPEIGPGVRLASEHERTWRSAVRTTRSLPGGAADHAGCERLVGEAPVLRLGEGHARAAGPAAGRADELPFDRRREDRVDVVDPAPGIV